jgi:hypothetical protein
VKIFHNRSLVQPAQLVCTSILHHINQNKQLSFFIFQKSVLKIDAANPTTVFSCVCRYTRDGIRKQTKNSLASATLFYYF